MTYGSRIDKKDVLKLNMKVSGSTEHEAFFRIWFRPEHRELAVAELKSKFEKFLSGWRDQIQKEMDSCNKQVEVFKTYLETFK